MKAEDFGIDVRTGYHNKQLTKAESRFVSILWEDHVGRENRLAADHFAVLFSGIRTTLSVPEFLSILDREGRRELERVKRDLRYLHNHLLREHSNIPVLSKAGNGGGYWIAESEAEAVEFYDTFRKRGLTGLVKASRGKQSATVDLVQQLAFEFDDLVDQVGATPMIRPRAGAPMPVEIVDAFLERMTQNPEKFADGLRKIGDKYGGILLPKEQVTAIQVEVAKLQEMAKDLGIN